MYEGLEIEIVKLSEEKDVLFVLIPSRDDIETYTKTKNPHRYKNSIWFRGLDEISNMIKYAKSKYNNKNLKFECEYVVDYEYLSSDLITSYYLLQFIKLMHKNLPFCLSLFE